MTLNPPSGPPPHAGAPAGAGSAAARAASPSAATRASDPRPLRLDYALLYARLVAGVGRTPDAETACLPLP